MAAQAIPVPNMEPLPLGEGFLRGAARDLAALYNTDALLKIQAMLSLVAIFTCSCLTPNASPYISDLIWSAGMIILVIYGSFLLAVISIPELNKDLFFALRRAFCIRYDTMLFCLRAAGIIMVLRAFVYFGNNLEKEDNINGFAIAAFLFGYMHIISICKLTNLPDVLSVADAFLAVAVMISAKLELATEFTHPVRICSTYLSMVILVLFRNAKVPFEKVTAAESKGLPPIAYPFGMVDGCCHALVVVSTKKQTLTLPQISFTN